MASSFDRGNLAHMHKPVGPTNRLTLRHPGLRRALNDVFGGSLASILTITYGLSYAVLIFSGPLAPLLPYGLAATFISAAVAAVVIGLGSSFPFAVAGPDSSTAAVTAILAAALADHMIAADPSAQLLGPLLITLSAATFVTGLVLCGFGVSRFGRAIRYVPYPVIGGFLGATACLIVAGAIQVITGTLCNGSISAPSPRQ
jgi:SulP family sulfate permease